MIATDLDWTLLRSDSTISDYTLSVLRKCRARGIKIVPATARSGISELPELFDLIDGVVSSNGAAVYDGNKLIFGRDMTMVNMRDLIVAATDAGVKIIVEGSVGSFYASFKTEDSWVNQWVHTCETVDFGVLDTSLRYVFAIADTAEETEATERVLSELLPHDLCLQGRADGRLMVFTHKAAIKSKGLAVLAERWEIDRVEIIAFGDDTIDIDLLEYCGIGVAVENALDEVKNAADHICESNDNDGVAKWLEQHVLTR